MHAKLAKYLPKPIEIRAATHHHLGQSFAIIYFPPHQDGFCIFEIDGTYQDSGGKMQTVFRHGEVFARHGTSSERWKQSDIAMIKRQLQTGADRVRDDAAEAVQLLQALPRQLGGSGLWLAMAVMPEYLADDPPMLTTYQAQQFLRDWQVATAPIEGFNFGGAMYRQPGAIIMTS